MWLRKQRYWKLHSQDWLDAVTKLASSDAQLSSGHLQLLTIPPASNQFEAHTSVATDDIQGGFEVVRQILVQTLAEYRRDMARITTVQNVPVPMVLSPESKRNWLKPDVAIDYGSGMVQQIELKHFKTRLSHHEPAQIIARLRRLGHTRVADRLYELLRIDDGDEQMRIDSLRIAIDFIGGAPVDVEDSCKIGIDYPAVWLSADGYLRLFWEREDRSRSLIVTCLTQGSIRLEIFDNDEDSTIELTYSEAIEQVYDFVAHI